MSLPLVNETSIDVNDPGFQKAVAQARVLFAEFDEITRDAIGLAAMRNVMANLSEVTTVPDKDVFEIFKDAQRKIDEAKKFIETFTVAAASSGTGLGMVQTSGSDYKLKDVLNERGTSENAKMAVETILELLDKRLEVQGDELININKAILAQTEVIKDEAEKNRVDGLVKSEYMRESSYSERIESNNKRSKPFARFKEKENKEDGGIFGDLGFLSGLGLMTAFGKLSSMMTGLTKGILWITKLFTIKSLIAAFTALKTSLAFVGGWMLKLAKWFGPKAFWITVIMVLVDAFRTISEHPKFAESVKQMKESWEKLIGIIGQIGDKVGALFTRLGEWIRSWDIEWINAILDWDGWTEISKAVKVFIGKWPDWYDMFIDGLQNWILGVGVSLMENVGKWFEGISDLLDGNFLKGFAKIFTAIGDFALTMFVPNKDTRQRMYAVGKKLIEGIMDSITSSIQFFVEHMKGNLKSFIDNVKRFKDTSVDMFKNLLRSILPTAVSPNSLIPWLVQQAVPDSVYQFAGIRKDGTVLPEVQKQVPEISATQIPKNVKLGTELNAAQSLKDMISFGQGPVLAPQYNSQSNVSVQNTTTSFYRDPGKAARSTSELHTPIDYMR